jgi:Derlin-2/3
MPALILALAYTYSQDNRGRNVSFFVVTIPVQWLPYAILLMTLIMSGSEVALSQASGLLSAHLYDFLTRLWPMFGGGRNYIQTPAIVKRLFGSNTQQTRRSYGTAFRPSARNQQAAQDTSQGTATGFGGVSGIWSNRGSGHRLGGD